MTHFEWFAALVNVSSICMLGFDWWCFETMKRWGHEKKTVWVYRNLAEPESKRDEATS